MRAWLTRVATRPVGGADSSRLDAPFPWLLLAIIVLSCVLAWGNEVYRTGDSFGYLTFTSSRTAAYPLFLDAVVAIFDTVEVIGHVQLVVNGLALAFFGFAMRRALETPVATLVLVAFLGNWPHLIKLHSEIMTESLTLSCIYLLLGSLALLLRRPSWRAAAVASLACGLAMTLRPVAVSLAPLLAIALWLVWRQCVGPRWPVIAALALPAALCVGVESATWSAYHGETSSASNSLPRHLFAKAVVIAEAPVVADPELARLVAHSREVMAPAREAVANGPTLQARTHLLRQLEQAAQFRTSNRVFHPLAHLVAERTGKGSAGDLIAEAGLEALMSQPAAWLGNGLMHYWGLWSSSWAFGPTSLASYRSYVESLPDTQLFAEAELHWPFAPSTDRVSHFGPVLAYLVNVTAVLGVTRNSWERALQWLMLASFIACFPAVALAVAQRVRRGCAESRIGLAALCALGIHGNFALCGLVAIGNQRYATAMLPLAAVCGLLLIVWGVRRVRSNLAAFRSK